MYGDRRIGRLVIASRRCFLRLRLWPCAGAVGSKAAFRRHNWCAANLTQNGFTTFGMTTPVSVAGMALARAALRSGLGAGGGQRHQRAIAARRALLAGVDQAA